MDRSRKDDLAALVKRLAGGGAAVIVATHDVEFAATFAERVVMLGDGVVIADGPAAEVLSGGWYFATEVARILDLPGVITAERTGPGGHSGAATNSSAVDSNPSIDASEKSLPGPATGKPTTPLPTAS